jgi:hypothetical protein
MLFQMIQNHSPRLSGHSFSSADQSFKSQLHAMVNGAKSNNMGDISKEDSKN